MYSKAIFAKSPAGISRTLFLSHVNVKAKEIDLLFAFFCCFFVFVLSEQKIKIQSQAAFFPPPPSLLWCFKISFQVQTRNSRPQTTFLQLSVNWSRWVQWGCSHLPTLHKHALRSPSHVMLNGQKRTGEKERLKKIDYKTPTLFFPLLLLLLHIFLQSLPPSVLHSLPSFPPHAFLSRHASVPANQHRPGQGEGARGAREKEGGREGCKQRSTVAASLGFWGGSTPGWRKKWGGGGGVQRGREGDGEGLSLRIEIKMNGRGAGVSALFTVIKRTSSASHFFTRNHQTHTHTQFAMLQFVWVSARDRRRVGDGSLFPGHCTIFA